jgi:hypothetical protein
MGVFVWRLQKHQWLQNHYMSTQKKLAQGLFGNFNKSYFDFIHDFMHNKPCFNPSHSQDLVDLEDDVYHTQPYP